MATLWTLLSRKNCRGRELLTSWIQRFPVQDRKYLFAKFNVDEMKRYRTSRVGVQGNENSCNNYYDSFSCISIATIWYAKKYKINLSVLGLGAVAFFVSSQVLEKIVHLLCFIHKKTRNHFAYAGASFYMSFMELLCLLSLKKLKNTPCLL